MRKQQPTPSPSDARKKRLGMVLGTAGFGILALFGFSFWSAQARQLHKAAASASIPTQVTLVAESPAVTLLPQALATDSPQPPTLTPIPTDAPLVVPTSTVRNVKTPMPPATATPRATPVPSTEAPLVNDSPGTATPTPTREPWPTTGPTLLRKPPSNLDVSQTHLWFSRPVDGNNGPSAPYRFGMTYDQRLSPHRGVDIANSTGTPVVAVGPGTVFYAGEDAETLFGPKPDFYGRAVVVKMEWSWNGRTIYTLYGHLDSVSVTAG